MAADAVTPRPLAELLRDVKLRPVFQSLPSPRDGHSPSLPDFQALHFSNYGSFDEPDDEETKDLASPACFGIRENRRMSLPWAVFNLLNANLGVGCIYLPFVFAQCGFLPSALVLLSITVLNAYTSILTGFCQQQSLSSSYPDIIEYYFQSIGRICFFGIFYIQISLEMILYQGLIQFCFGQLLVHSFIRKSAILIFPIILNSSTFDAFIIQRLNVLSTVTMILFYLLLIGICSVTIWYKRTTILCTEWNWRGILQCFGIGSFVYRNCQLCVPTLLNSMDASTFRSSVLISFPVTYIIYLLAAGIHQTILFDTFKKYIYNVVLGILASRELNEDVIYGLLHRFPKSEKTLIILLLFVSVLRYALVTSPLAEGCATWALDTINFFLRRISERTRAYSQDDTPHLHEFSPREGLRYSKTLFAILSFILKVLLTVIVWSTSASSPTVYTILLIIGACNGVLISCTLPICCYLKSRRTAIIVERSWKRSLSGILNRLIIIGWLVLGGWLLMTLIEMKTLRG